MEPGRAACTPLREKMFDLAADAGAASIVLVWARGHLDWEVPAVREKLLQWLYDKVSTFLGRRNAVGVVVDDELGGGPKDRAKWLRETLPLTDEGTGYTRPEQIVLPIVTAPSHHILYLQLAGLVTAATVAAVAGNPYALDLMPRLIRIADRLPDGRVGGAGLTVWPPDNLRTCTGTCTASRSLSTKAPHTNSTLSRPPADSPGSSNLRGKDAIVVP